jgi:hypothetical protein
MSGREGTPQASPADANQINDPTSPEQLAINAAERLEAIYDVIVSGRTGIRNIFERVDDPGRPQDAASGTPALYTDRIGFGTTYIDGKNDAPVEGLYANRPETVPPPFRLEDRTLAASDVAVDYGGRTTRTDVENMRPSAGRAARANLTRFARVVTRDEAGEPLYEDVAFIGAPREDVDPKDRFLVRRNRLRKPGAGDGTSYSIDLHPDTEAFTRITTEAADVILEAAKARAEQPLTEAKAVVEACEALATF